MPERLAEGVFCHLVEGYALGLVGIEPENCGKVPAYGLALAVRVGGKQDLGGGFCFFFKRIYQLALSADIYIFRFKIVFDIYTQLAFGKIPYVPYGGNHLISLSEKALYGAGL